MTLANLTLENDTISANAAGGLGTYGASHPIVANTIIAGNTPGSYFGDVGNAVTSLGHNLIGNTTGSSGWLGTDFTGTAANPINPDLWPLANYGGPTESMLPMAASPAVDAGSNVLVPAGVMTDQRAANSRGSSMEPSISARWNRELPRPGLLRSRSAEQGGCRHVSSNTTPPSATAFPCSTCQWQVSTDEASHSRTSRVQHRRRTHSRRRYRRTAMNFVPCSHQFAGFGDKQRGNLLTVGNAPGHHRQRAGQPDGPPRTGCQLRRRCRRHSHPPPCNGRSAPTAPRSTTLPAGDFGELMPLCCQSPPKTAIHTAPYSRILSGRRPRSHGGFERCLRSHCHAVTRPTRPSLPGRLSPFPRRQPETRRRWCSGTPRQPRAARLPIPATSPTYSFVAVFAQ